MTSAGSCAAWPAVRRSAVAIKVGRQRILLLLDPALVGQLLVEHAAVTTKGPGVQLTRQMLGNGLLTSEGKPHDRARKLIAPAFSPRRLAGYTESFAERTRARTDGWHDGDTLDMHDEMACLTLDIVGRTLLGIDLTDQRPSRSEVRWKRRSSGSARWAAGRC